MTINLPSLRGDLVFSERPIRGDRRFVAKDPRSGRFFQLGEVEHFIGQQLDGRTPLEEVCRRTAERFEAELELDVVRRYVERMSDLGLLECGRRKVPAPARRIRGNLLYLRFPAFDPDRLLTRLERGTRWLFTRQTVVGCGALVALAAWLSWTSPGLLAGGVARLHGAETLLAIWITLLVVTLLHEFAHGLTCKHFGGQVREMGFMLIYFPPSTAT